MNEKNNPNSFINRMRQQVAAANAGFPNNANGPVPAMQMVNGGIAPVGSQKPPKQVAAGFTS